MENKKTEKKRIFSKLTVCVAALALVSCAFVGGTFARYTNSGAVDNGGANIADWYIDVQDGSGTEDVVFTISPAETAYGSTNRVNTANDGGVILTFVNRGEVDATIKVTKGDSLVVYGKKWDDTQSKWTEYELTDGFEGTDMAGNKFKWQAVSGSDTVMKPLFVGENNTYVASAEWSSVALYDSTDTYTPAQDPAPATNPSKSMLGLGGVSFTSADREEEGAGQIVVSGDGSEGDPWTVTLAPGEEISVTMSATVWVSDFDSDSTNKGRYGNTRDTWVGQNISRIGYSFSWTAEQASKLPE